MRLVHERSPATLTELARPFALFHSTVCHTKERRKRSIQMNNFFLSLYHRSRSSTASRSFNECERKSDPLSLSSTSESLTCCPFHFPQSTNIYLSVHLNFSLVPSIENLAVMETFCVKGHTFAQCALVSIQVNPLGTRWPFRVCVLRVCSTLLQET